MELLPFEFNKSGGFNERGILLTLDDDDDLGRLLPILHNQERHQFNGRSLIAVRHLVTRQGAVADGTEQYGHLVTLARRFPGAAVMQLYSQNYSHILSKAVSDGNTTRVDVIGSEPEIIAQLEAGLDFSKSTEA